MVDKIISAPIIMILMTNVDMEKRRETKIVLNPEAIPIEGALGLLALGSAGLRAWRNVRDAAITTKGIAVDIASAGDTAQDPPTGRSGQGGAT